MIEKQNNFPPAISLEDAQNQIVDLRRQLTELEVRNRMMWTLLAEVSRRLQTSSTSIKAAVSSLLDYDIFWDGSTQHEFLETIDSSVDQGASLIMLMMLAFRSEANNLEINPEPHTLQEILSGVLDTISASPSEFHFDVVSSEAGKPVLVDYEYLAVSLRLLMEVLVNTEAVSSNLQVMETENYWYLDILYVSEPIATALDHFYRGNLDGWMLIEHIAPENALKLFTASKIIRSQNIQLEIHTDETGEKGKMKLRLIIPIALMA